MKKRTKLSDEAKRLIREYALHVARKKHPEATIHVHVDDFTDENGRAKRSVTIVHDHELA